MFVLIRDTGTKIPKVGQHGQKKKKRKKSTVQGGGRG